jgi:hypothetical protein
MRGAVPQAGHVGRFQEREALIHYAGWKPSYDEWLPTSSGRLQVIRAQEICLHGRRP